MKPMATISGREAFVRVAVVVVAEVLLIATMFGIFGMAPSLALDVVVIVSLFALVAGIFIGLSWAFGPWIARRTERRLWEGTLRLDQADMLRRNGLSK